MAKDAFLESLRKSKVIKAKILDNVFAQNLYAALCNIKWINESQKEYGYTWRRAGAIVAELRNSAGVDKEEDYMTWYCSSVEGLWNDEKINPDFVNEGTVTKEIRMLLKALGYYPQEYGSMYYKRSKIANKTRS